LGLKLDAVSGFASLIWAPTGLALAAILICGFRIWPAIFLGAFTVNLSTGAHFLSACGIAIGNSLEALLGGYLLLHVFHFRKTFDRQKDVVSFLLTLILCTAVSATVGVFSLGFAPAGHFEGFLITWKAWWVGDILGGLIVAPVVLALSQLKMANLRFFKLFKVFEALLLTLSLFSLGRLVFGIEAKDHFAEHFPYLMFPFIIWAALRFDHVGAVLATFGISLMAIGTTMSGLGPFTAGSLRDNFFLMHSFISVISITGLFLSAAISERDEAQRLAQAALRAKGEFLANLSHEIRAPLGAILGFSELLVDKKTSPQEKQNISESIKNNGDLLSNIINDILDYSKVEAGQIEIEISNISMQELLVDIESLLKLQTSFKGLNYKLEIEGDLPKWIKTDFQRLKQILYKLIGNAVKFTERGSLHLVINLQLSGSSGKLIFKVKDSGIGLSPTQLKKLFQPFSADAASTWRSLGGAGLGLVLAKHYAKLLGGDVILLDSKQGQGSTFQVSINPGPVIFKQYELPELQKSETMQNAICLENIKVLVVEDSSDNQKIIQLFLKMAGAQVDMAENGQQALDKIINAHYDIVLMDLQMPVMGGVEATAQLRNRGVKTPIIAVTANALKSEHERCLEIGFNDHISKPIRRQILLETVRKHFDQASAQI
jgi:signal transduction histidine kinase/ActR/RegA family two-component response regulator